MYKSPMLIHPGGSSRHLILTNSGNGCHLSGLDWYNVMPSNGIVGIPGREKEDLRVANHLPGHG